MQSNGFLKTQWLLTLKNLNPLLSKINQTSKPKQLLGTHIDDQLSFNLHISNICKSTSKQLFVRLKCLLGFEIRKVLINGFILSNFNYCPLFGPYHQLSLKIRLKICKNERFIFYIMNTAVRTKNYLKSQEKAPWMF